MPIRRAMPIVAFTALLSTAACAQGGDHFGGCATIGWPPLGHSDPVYREALDVARMLTDGGFNVWCIAPSKMTRVFEEQTGAALYRTDEGSIEAMFFSGVQNLDGLRIVEQQEGGRYLYSVAGYPKARSAVIDASRPVYFVRNANRLIVVHDKELADRVRPVFAER